MRPFCFPAEWGGGGLAWQFNLYFFKYVKQQIISLPYTTKISQNLSFLGGGGGGAVIFAPQFRPQSFCTILIHV